MEQVDEFCDAHDLTDHKESFRLGALIAQSPADFEDITELPESEKHMIRRETTSESADSTGLDLEKLTLPSQTAGRSLGPCISRSSSAVSVPAFKAGIKPDRMVPIFRFLRQAISSVSVWRSRAAHRSPSPALLASISLGLDFPVLDPQLCFIDPPVFTCILQS